MTQTWPIRPAYPTDVSALVSILTSQSPWQELGYDAFRCLALIEPALPEIRIADGGDEGPAGFIRWQPDGFLRQPYIQILAVAPEQQRRGVGTALLRWVEEEVFQRRSAANLFLTASAFNLPARAFYRARGYTECGVLTGYLRAGMDEVLVRKSVRPLLG